MEKRTHPEHQYLDLLIDILTIGETRDDRTKIGTQAIFGPRMVFDLRQGFPLLTTKKMWFEGIKKELLFFLSGKTDTKILEAQGVNIWHDNTTAEYLAKYKLPWREGDMGPGYGHQWRHAGAEYKGCDIDYVGKGVDQVQNLIDGLKKDPYGRRHILSAWDPATVHLTALPPCHSFSQFNVGCEDKRPKYLDCMLHQRSGDMFLGVPFNIASYALLMEILGQLTGLIPRKFIYNLGDAHIYSTHVEQVLEQAERTPYPFPKIRFPQSLTNVDDLRPDQILLEGYVSHAKLTGEMAI
jgi:thymidylate synthase